MKAGTIQFCYFFHLALWVMVSISSAMIDRTVQKKLLFSWYKQQCIWRLFIHNCFIFALATIRGEVDFFSIKWNGNQLKSLTSEEQHITFNWSPTRMEEHPLRNTTAMSTRMWIKYLHSIAEIHNDQAITQ